MGNDDGSSTALSHMRNVPLTANKTYIMVMTSFHPDDVGDVSFFILGPGRVDVRSNSNSSDVSSNLTGLNLSGNPQNYTFAEDTYLYNDVTVDHDVEAVTLSPTGVGIITINGEEVASGGTSSVIPLAIGEEKTITVEHAEGGNEPKQYIINITRINNAPSLSLTNPTDNLTYGNGDDISISGTVSDLDGDDVTVSATIAGKQVTDTVAGGNGAWTLTWDIDVLGIQDGTYTDITFTADDGETNTLDYTGNIVVDKTAPTVINKSVENIADKTADIKLTVDEEGTAYYVVLGAEETVPTKEQVKAGQDSTGSSVAIKGNSPVISDTEQTFTITGLTGGTGYKVYWVVEDSVGNISDATSESFVTDLPKLVINNATETEGNSGTTTITFTVSLSDPTSETVTVDYATSDDTAKAGNDYIAASGTLVFAPQETSKNIDITINGDVIDEGDETFQINLSNPSHAEIEGVQGVGTITNDDTAGITITETEGTTKVAETGTTDIFTIALNTQPESDVVLKITSEDTGEVTLDKTTLTFTPTNWNNPQIITVTGIDDTLEDGEQTANITISVKDESSDDIYSALVNRTVAVTIQDNECPEINITGNNQDITKGDTTPETTDNTDFGIVDIAGDPVIKTFTVENLGLAGLTLTGTPLISITGANDNDFIVEQQPIASISTGATTTFQIKFAPRATGKKIAEIRIANNDEDENPYTFTIKGTGTSDTQGPTVETFIPADEATNVAITSNLEILFSEEIMARNMNLLTLEKEGFITEYVYGIDDNVLILETRWNIWIMVAPIQ